MTKMHMIDRAKDLEAAAKDIDPACLQAAKDAMDASCKEYIRWAQMFFCRLETVEHSDLHKFARAFSLTLLGHLPTRPETCPFCIQYGRDRACAGCGYAATHSRCDADDSAFSIFIEAFHGLGRAIHQDTGELCCSPSDARKLLNSSIAVSCELAIQMQKDLLFARAQRIMELKAAYLDAMICLLPGQLLSDEVRERRLLVRRTLLGYW